MLTNQQLIAIIQAIAFNDNSGITDSAKESFKGQYRCFPADIYINPAMAIEQKLPDIVQLQMFSVDYIGYGFDVYFGVN